MNGINVVSLFDGISCLRLALERSNIKVKNYWASEIDSNAIKISQSNWNDIVQVGDITKLKFNGEFKIDLLAGGSPCQSVSLSNKGGGNITEGKSALFFEYARLLKEINPKYFLLENVPMNKFSMDTISNILEVEPLIINSNLVSFQNRKRLYWTNIPNINQPLDKEIYLKDNYSKTYDNSLILKEKGLNKLNRNRCRVTSVLSDKCPTLMKSQEKLPTDAIVFEQNGIYRYPTRDEIELMQNLPIGYTNAVNYRLATGATGNGWTVDVISHILNHI